MKRLTTAAVAAFLGLALAVSPARAGPAADALGACMAEHTTDKDRTDMMRFVFLGMASHPDFVNFFNITLVDRAEISQKYADIMTRLMTENCPEQARAAISEGGQAVIGDAFDAMINVILLKLVANPKVRASHLEFGKYLDQRKFESAFPEAFQRK